MKKRLQKGIETEVQYAFVANGYNRDQEIRILLPPEVQIITSIICKLPHGDALIDNSVKNFNAAASDAVLNVTSIFGDCNQKQKQTRSKEYQQQPTTSKVKLIQDLKVKYNLKLMNQ